MADDEYKKGGGGRIKHLGVMLLFLVMAYLSIHLYFIWLPVGQTNVYAQSVMDAKVSGVKVFPAIESYDFHGIDARKDLLSGRKLSVSPLPERLATAIERNEPVTFTESEINVWLRHRLQVRQGGFFESDVKVKGVWVNLTHGELELVIERELAQNMEHFVSLYMRFEPIKNGFTIHRHAAHIGQVKLPGGFARLVMPAFSRMADELSDELKLYKDDSLTSDKALKIHRVLIEEGKITLDPRLPSMLNQ